MVTPGIRPGANVMDNADDQTRIMTAQKAIIAGADHVVVGRPITKDADPAAVIVAMKRDIDATCA
jgi:orotidine-5'-phosphate decarboxylase